MKRSIRRSIRATRFGEVRYSVDLAPGVVRTYTRAHLDVSPQGAFVPQPAAAGSRATADSGDEPVDFRASDARAGVAWRRVRHARIAVIEPGLDGRPQRELVISTRHQTHHFRVYASELSALASILAAQGPAHRAPVARAGRVVVQAPLAAARISAAVSARALASARAAVSARAATAVAGRRGRHGQGALARILTVGAGVVIAAAGAGGIGGLVAPRSPAAGAAAQGAVSYPALPSAIALVDQRDHGGLHLAPATAPPLPTPPVLAQGAPLGPHEIFGFAPYWTLPGSAGFNLSSLTTLAYFGVGVNPNGTLDQADSGWNGFESQDLADLITRAHLAGDRVVLTVENFDQGALNQLASDPAVPGRLAAELTSALQAKNLDGVNFDFEGTGPQDRTGLTHLIATVSTLLHGVDPHWQVTVDTYASSAGDPSGFYDIGALAPSVDGFFVMAYDMGSRSVPSPTAPLTGPSFNDVQAVEQYLAVAPASKIILGVPYYGYDWATANGFPGAAVQGGPTPMSYAQIVQLNAPTYWDPTSDTPWSSYQVNGQWHQVFFDDPTSLALKADLANFFHLRGLGIWALGMDGNDPAMMAALLGNAAPYKNLPTGPTLGNVTTTTVPTTTTTVPTTTTTTGPLQFTYTGTWGSTPVTLTPVPGYAPPQLATASTYEGPLTHFATDNPAEVCLENQSTLDVFLDNRYPGRYIVYDYRPPARCANEAFSFPIPSAANGGVGTPAGSGTTSTVATADLRNPGSPAP